MANSKSSGPIVIVVSAVISLIVFIIVAVVVINSGPSSTDTVVPGDGIINAPVTPSPTPAPAPAPVTTPVPANTVINPPPPQAPPVASPSAPPPPVLPTSVPAPAAAPAPAPAPGVAANILPIFLEKQYRIRFKTAENKCLFPNNIWQCYDDPNMVFKLESAGDEIVRIHHIRSGRCLFIDSGNLSLQSWTCWKDSNMVFKILYIGNGNIRLRHEGTQKCIAPNENKNGGSVSAIDCEHPGTEITLIEAVETSYVTPTA